MKTTDRGHYTEIELETDSGMANYLYSLKGDNPSDRRCWQRDAETQELNQFLADNRNGAQFVVKTGDVFSRVK
jgi:hypothetical protein